MNLGRVKTFLIVLFLGINVYLVLSTAASTEFRTDDKTIENTITVLNRADISVNKAVIPKKTENLKNIETVNTVYTENFKNSGNADLFTVEGDLFTCEVRAKIFEKNDKKIFSEIKSFLAKSGFDTGFMEFVKESFAKDCKKYKIICKVKGFEVFDSVIDVSVKKDAYALSGVWYEPQSTSVKLNSSVRKNVYVTSVLADFSSREEVKEAAPISIKDISTGYMSGSVYGKSGHLTATALPYYRITDSKNNVYYYDATDGSYLTN